MIVRQGDVILVRVPRVPTDAEPAKVDGPALVLAYGESSGHRHQLPARGNKLYQRGSSRFLEIGSRGGAWLKVTSDKGAPLPAERHTPVKLAPGNYRVVIQREWTVDQEIRRVED